MYHTEFEEEMPLNDDNRFFLLPIQPRETERKKLNENNDELKEHFIDTDQK